MGADDRVDQTETDPLTTVLTAAGITDHILGETHLSQLTAALRLDAVAADDLVEYVSSIADWNGETAHDGEFEFRVGRWYLNLRKEAARGALLAGILAAVLEAADAPTPGVAILTAVIPSLLTIEDVTLTTKDRRLLFQLRQNPALTSGALQIGDVYQGLPANVREQINELDFYDFVERLRRAGLTRTTTSGILTSIRGADERIPWIQWR